MQSSADEDTLRLYFSRIIEAIDQCIKKFKHKKSNNDDDLSSNFGTFTLDNEENELLDSLTEDIETEINECLPELSTICYNSFIDYLYQYNYDREKQQFSHSLTKNAIYSIRQELQGLLGKSIG